MDWIILIEIILIIASVTAIYKFSTQKEAEEPGSVEEFIQKMWQYIDTKLGNVQKTPQGLLTKEFALAM